MLSISYSVPNTGVWFYSINKVNPLVLLFPDYSGIQSEFSLCKPPSSAQDIHQLNGLLRNAFTLMAMLDYPYSTHFMGNMPANPVKVQTAGSLKCHPSVNITYSETILKTETYQVCTLCVQPSQVVYLDKSSYSKNSCGQKIGLHMCRFNT